MPSSKTPASSSEPYIKHNDPGHGWLAVPVAELTALGIAGIISSYSYLSRDQQTAYLEEDNDFPRFYEAFVAKYARPPEYRIAHSDHDSFVRKLQPYEIP